MFLSCAWLLWGCTFRDAISEATPVACGPAGECPQGLRCNATSNRCRPAQGFDDAPPVLEGAARVTLTPTDAGLVQNPSAWGPSSELSVEAVASEPLGKAALRFEPEVPARCAVQISGARVSARCTMEGPVGELNTALRLQVEDAEANAATFEVAQLAIDGLAPPPPEVDSPDAVLLTVAPWGSATRPLAHRVLSLTAPTAPLLDVFGVNATPLRLSTSPGQAISLELSGSSLEVSLRSVDLAGNGSPVVQVQWVEGVAALNPQPLYGSPHEVLYDPLGQPELFPLAAPLRDAGGPPLTVSGRAALRPVFLAHDAGPTPFSEPWSRRRWVATPAWPPHLLDDGSQEPRPAWADAGPPPSYLEGPLVDLQRRATWFYETRIDGGFLTSTLHRVSGSTHLARETLPVRAAGDFYAFRWFSDSRGVSTGLTFIYQCPLGDSCDPRPLDVYQELRWPHDGGAPGQGSSFSSGCDVEADWCQPPPAPPSPSARSFWFEAPDGGETVLSGLPDDTDCEGPAACASVSADGKNVYFPNGTVSRNIALVTLWGVEHLEPGRAVVNRILPSGVQRRGVIDADGGFSFLPQFDQGLGAPGVGVSRFGARKVALFDATTGVWMAELTDAGFGPFTAVLGSCQPGQPGAVRRAVDARGQLNLFCRDQWSIVSDDGGILRLPIDDRRSVAPDVLWSQRFDSLTSNGELLRWRGERPALRFLVNTRLWGVPLSQFARRRVQLDVAGSARASVDGGTSARVRLGAYRGLLRRMAPPVDLPATYEVPPDDLLAVPDDGLVFLVEPEGTNFAREPAALSLESVQARLRYQRIAR